MDVTVTKVRQGFGVVHFQHDDGTRGYMPISFLFTLPDKTIGIVDCYHIFRTTYQDDLILVGDEWRINQRILDKLDNSERNE